MEDSGLTRAEFLRTVGKIGVGACCACALTGSIYKAMAEETSPDSASVKPGASPESERAVERIKFAEGWVTRFFNELDSNIPEDLRQKLMMANGRSCYLAWITDENVQEEKYEFARWAEWVKNHPSESVQADGNVIHFKYTSAAETGLPSDEGACLCPFVETKPKGLSPTYCFCSVGYVKVMHERMFGQPVEVELMESVLQGGKRCHFKITVG
jgi:hypothetical protein